MTSAIAETASSTSELKQEDIAALRSSLRGMVLTSAEDGAAFEKAGEVWNKMYQDRKPRVIVQVRGEVDEEFDCFGQCTSFSIFCSREQSLWSAALFGMVAFPFWNHDTRLDPRFFFLSTRLIPAKRQLRKTSSVCKSSGRNFFFQYFRKASISPSLINPEWPKKHIFAL